MKSNIILCLALFFCSQMYAQVNSIRPDTAQPGQFLTTYITVAGGTFQVASPPWSYMDVYLQQGAGYTIYTEPTYDPFVNIYQGCVNFWCDSLFADFDIPIAAPPGYYDVHVISYDFQGTPTDNILPNGFYIGQYDALIEGDIYFDINQNGIWDGGEPPLFNHRAVLNPGNFIAYTNVLGHYRFYSSAGTYTVDYLPSPSFTQTSVPVTYNLTVPPDAAGNDFGTFSSLVYGSQYFSVSHQNFRCAPSSGYTNVQIYNNGMIPTQGSVTMVYSTNLTFTGSLPAPDVMNGDTLTWYYPLINPGSSFTIGPYGNQITFLDPPAGDTIWFTTIDSVFDALGNFIHRYTDSHTTVVRCSFDPNDKHASPAGESPAHITPPGSTLDYTVNFQNTGNDTAFTVVIVDSLDANLDWNTFAVLNSSHAVDAQMDPNGVVRFTFSNILLPDSNIDEPGSHGFVVFRITADSLLPDPTTVYNTGYIYFDANPPVITNTVFNTLTVLQFPSASFTTAGVNLCPGTCTDFVNQSANATSYLWTFNGSSTPSSTSTNPSNICYNNPGNYDVTLIATNALGSDSITSPNYIQVYPQPPAQTVLQNGDTLLAQQAFVVYQWFYQGDTIPGATSSWYIATLDGDYSLICVDANGCSVETVILNVITSLATVPAADYLNVYPNPVRDRIVIQKSFESSGGLSVMIYNTVGQCVRNLHFKQSKGQTELVIPASGLDKGVYTIELTDGERVYRNRFVKE